MDSKEGFSGRAGYYAKYRPRYPEALLHYMKLELHLSPRSILADVGSGSGILSELFLKNGNMVSGIEPSDDMRRSAEGNLARYTNFRSINGSAESTNLPDKSVDFVTAAQSFHWFEPNRTKIEFQRILRPEGWTVLIWNTRRKTTPFLQAYDNLLNLPQINKRRSRHEDVDQDALHRFLGDYRESKLPNSQDVDFEGLVGRFLSASYAPLPGTRGYDIIVRELQKIFNQFEANGLVRFEYETEIYASQLAKGH